MYFREFFKTLPIRLARVTSGGKIIREVDGLRFVAIFPVVIQHMAERLERYSVIEFNPGFEFDFFTFLANRGFIGVYIFFLISGFILGMPFASHFLAGGHKVSLKNYFWRRLTRLEPPYIIVMTLVSIFLVLLGYYSFSEILPHFIASIFYLHSIIFHSWTFINPPVWTLEIEVQFYILAPFLAMLAFRINSTALRRIVFIAIILSILWFQHYFRINHTFTVLTILAHVHYFLMGFLLADIYLIDWKNGIKRSFIFDWLSIVAFSIAIWVWSWDFYFINRLVFSISIFVLAYSVFRSTWVNRFLTLPWITAIGGMCYTIYLIHLPIIEYLITFTKEIYFTNIFTINLMIQFILLAPIILVLSIIFFLLVEKPCMYKDWPQRLKASILGKLK